MIVTIEGSQGAGKSTLLRMLKEAGCYVGPETATDDSGTISAVVELPKIKKAANK